MADDPRGTGAPFVIAMAFVIVLYIIFVPPDVRQEILGDSPSSGVPVGSNQPTTVDTSPGDDFVFDGPGPVSKQDRDSYTKDISTFTLNGNYETGEIVKVSNFLVSRTLFSDTPYELTFTTKDELEDISLSFASQTHDGILTISLNDNIVLRADLETYNIAPIPIDAGLLEQKNVLQFSVDSPGLAFWDKKEYRIENLKLIADQIDRDGLFAFDQFEIRAVEMQQLESAKLRFFPDCSAQDGKLSIYINGQRTYSKQADCGVLNVVPLSRSLLEVGTNTIEFELEYGSYLIDRTEIITNLEQNEGVTYYFTLDDNLFSRNIETQNLCGEADGVCPANCGADIDKDCCFSEYITSYWCDVPTSLTSDRCVGFVDDSNAFRCPSAYEDERGDVPDDYEGVCGDDNDNFCPAACSGTYDADCCLVDDSDAFFCNDLPTGGLGNICKQSLTQDECRFCPSGYEGEGSNPSCTYRSPVVQDNDVVLDSDLAIEVEFIFVDDGDNKEAEVIVNGYTTSFDTFDDSVTIDISSFTRDGNNYIQVIPESDFSLVQVRVDIKDV